MKANLTILNGHHPTQVQLKADKVLSSQTISSKFISNELQKSKTGKFVIPAEKLTEIQMQQILDLPGAYLLSDNISLTDEISPVDSHQQPYIQIFKERFLVKHSNKLFSIEVSQIAYFYADNRLNFIKTWNNKTYIIDKTMEEISSLLNKNDFFRINRSFIIAYKSIEEVYIHFNNRLKLKLNVPVSEEVFVSKDRVANFKEWLGD